jgi:AcrR family transcriptional regulator
MPQRTTSATRVDADLRTSILDAARHLIVANGHRDVSMRDIAGAVGCSVSSLYLYFANRDALIHTLIDEGFQRWYDEQVAINARHAEPWARLEAMARAYIAFGLERAEYYEIMYLFHPQSMERLPKELYRRARRGFDLLAGTVLACAPAGRLSDDAVRLLTASLWASLHGVVATMLTARLDTRIDRDRYIESSIRFALAGVRAGVAGEGSA